MLLLLACTGPVSDSSSADPVAVASARGPHEVGHGETEVVYPDLLGDDRSLRTAVWWPSDEDSGIPAAYFHGTVESEGASEDAAPGAGAFPLVVWSHGHQAYAESSSFLMEHLASHGFVVIAPDHTGNTTLDGGERETLIYLQRSLDLTAVVDALADDALPVPSSSWDGQAVVMGHSFGGYSAYASAGAVYDVDAIEASCEDGTGGDVCTDWSEAWATSFAAGVRDDRFLAALAMAPGDYTKFGDGGLANLPVPTLLMTGELDPENDADGALYRAAGELRGDHSVELLGAGHDSFTDFAGKLDPTETLAPEDGWRIVNAFGLAFAALTTGDDAYDGILDGSLTVDEAVVLR